MHRARRETNIVFGSRDGSTIKSPRIYFELKKAFKATNGVSIGITY